MERDCVQDGGSRPKDQYIVVEKSGIFLQYWTQSVFSRGKKILDIISCGGEINRVKKVDQEEMALRRS